MLIPRFTLRTYFVVCVMVALMGVVANYAWKGQTWAVALLAAVGSFVVMFVLYAAAFIGAWGFVEIALARARRRQQPTSPFATDRPAPQVLPPVRSG
ncbi:MAG: hypothetical protein KatS3mg110_0129 [Pirellulaceae bacterium]|nr:MAG: hypothetical protein KatS3mg110_0129 [Pirellulaceae bacterium]